MHRPILYAQEQGRTYDFLTLARETLYALGIVTADLLGSTSMIVTGLAATASGPASLVINLAAGRIYQQMPVDATQYGTLSSDSRTVTQQGFAPDQTVTFSTAGISSGQSRYALVQAMFTQTDVIPSDDPNSGVLPYYNASSPSNPLLGPGNAGTSQNTRRTGVCTIAVKYGAPATTGTEVAPSADSGYVGLYLVDLAYGQTQITQGQIALASNAPFLVGLLGSHHSGGSGQAPKIILTSEVQGVLPLANLPSYPMSKLPGSSSVAGGGIATCYAYAGNPNGHVAGVAGVAGTSPPDVCVDTTTGALWVCTTTGNAAAATWSPPLPVVNENVGQFGDTSHVLTLTVDARGRISAISQTQVMLGCAALSFTVSGGSITARSGFPSALVSSLARTSGGTFTFDGTKLPSGCRLLSEFAAGSEGTISSPAQRRFVQISADVLTGGTVTFNTADFTATVVDPGQVTLVFGV